MNLKLNVVLEKNGLTHNKLEGDKKTPKGTYSLNHYIIGKIN